MLSEGILAIDNDLIYRLLIYAIGFIEILLLLLLNVSSCGDVAQPKTVA